MQSLWDTSLSLEIKENEAKSTIFYFGSIMPKGKWWAHVSYGFCQFDSQKIPTVYAGS